MSDLLPELALALLQVLPSLWNSTMTSSSRSKSNMTSSSSSSSSYPYSNLTSSGQADGPPPLEEIPLSSSSSLSSLFEEAVRYLSNQKNQLKPSQAHKLRLYALFKVAAVGPCTATEPSVYDMVERAKWQSWMSLSHLSPEEAKSQYVNLLFTIKPNWRERKFEELQAMEEAWREATAKNHQPEERDEYGLTPGEHDLESERHQEKQFGAVFSVPKHDSDDVSDADKDVYYWCQEGHLGKVKELLVVEEIDTIDKEGEGLLHWAVDRSHVEVVKYLLNKGADVNLSDVHGQTPLFFAVLCESEELVSLLLKAGADPNVVDKDGSSLMEFSSPRIRALFGPNGRDEAGMESEEYFQDASEEQDEDEDNYDGEDGDDDNNEGDDGDDSEVDEDDGDDIGDIDTQE